MRHLKLLWEISRHCCCPAYGVKHISNQNSDPHTDGLMGYLNARGACLRPDDDGILSVVQRWLVDACRTRSAAQLIRVEKLYSSLTKRKMKNENCWFGFPYVLLCFWTVLQHSSSEPQAINSIKNSKNMIDIRELDEGSCHKKKIIVS